MKRDGAVSSTPAPRSATLPSGGQSEKTQAEKTERNYAITDTHDLHQSTNPTSYPSTKIVR